MRRGPAVTAAADRARALPLLYALPLLLRIGLVLVALLIGAAAALILFPARSKPDEADEEDENARRQRLATERDSAASGLQTALDACRGLPARLTRIAEGRRSESRGLTRRPRRRGSSPRHTA